MAPNAWTFKTLKNEKEEGYAPKPIGAAASGGLAGLGLGTGQWIGIGVVSLVVAAGAGVGIAAGVGAFDASPSPPAPPASPPSPPATPPPPCIDDGADTCQWVSRDHEDGIAYKYVYDAIESLASNTDSIYLHSDGRCDEAGGDSNWMLQSVDTGLNWADPVPFVCDAKTDSTDCCHFNSGFYDAAARRRSRRQLEAYVYNASVSLPPQIVLPLSARIVKRILDDRSVTHVTLPNAFRQAFFLLATAEYNYTGSDPFTPNPAASGPCLATGLKTKVSVCTNVSSTQCGFNYVELVDGKIAAQCLHANGVCGRDAWLRIC